MAADSLEDTRLKTIASILCAGALLASTSFAAGSGASNGRTLYKWVDAQGVTHYGDQIPPEYAGQEQQSQNRDHNLLSTYASVQEIERLRDQRLTLLSDQIKVTSQFLEVLNGRLTKLRAGSMHFKPYNSDPAAPPMPDQVAEDLVRVGNDIRTQEQNLHAKQSEESKMRNQFESDIQRFKELKGIH